MSLHSSLRVDSTQGRHRNVLKRHERIQRLIETEKWKDRQTAFGLPKVKSLKVKVKKIKAEKAVGAAAAAAPGAAAPSAAPAGADKKKSQAGAEKKQSSGEKK